MSKTVFHTDGACSGNPGPGGWAVVMEKDGERHTLNGGSPHTTNNIMEMTAVLEALKWADREASNGHLEIVLRMDSEYVRKGLTEWMPGWKRRNWRTSSGGAVKNQELWQELDAAYSDLKSKARVDLVHVKGHAGDPGNELADDLAVEARDRSFGEVSDWRNPVQGRAQAAPRENPEDAFFEEGKRRGYKPYRDHTKPHDSSYCGSTQLKVIADEDIRYFINIDVYDLSKFLQFKDNPINAEVQLQFYPKDDMEGDPINIMRPFTSFSEAERFAHETWHRLNCGAYEAGPDVSSTNKRAEERLNEALKLVLDVMPADMAPSDLVERLESLISQKYSATRHEREESLVWMVGSPKEAARNEFRFGPSLEASELVDCMEVGDFLVGKDRHGAVKKVNQLSADGLVDLGSDWEIGLEPDDDLTSGPI